MRDVLASRSTAAALVVLTGTGAFCAIKLWLTPGAALSGYAPLLGLALFQVVVLMCVQRGATTSLLERVLVADMAAVCAAIAWAGVVPGRATGSDFFLMGLAMLGAALVPWRPRSQATLAVVAAIAILANAYGANAAMTGTVDFRTFVPAAVLLGASVYTSYTLQAAELQSARADLLRRSAEAETREQSMMLERNVLERTAEFQAANDELEAFSYSVSHDLRAPLRAMDALSQALLEDYGASLDIDARDYLQRIRGETGRLGDLIDDLLRLSRVTRSIMTREVVDLSAVASIEAARLRSSCPQRDVQFVIAPGMHASCDGALVRVLLENLLGNAFKFTRKTARARIEFGFEQHDSGRVYVVRDNGVGFDMAHVSKVFEAFERLHSADDFEGTGIGLTTADRIVRRHGGTITAHAQPGEGATLRFTLGPAGEEIS
ncbi:MAG: hypothetical protein HY899_14010 [Deltaproteobacteria bacterium]|nr:hypothetical protein [Deltaproteobacteria bacterium]